MDDAVDAVIALTKLFADPMPSPCVLGRRSLPFGTEVLSNPIEEDYIPNSPIMWADPLVPYSITIGANKVAVSSMPAVEVAVNLLPEPTTTLELSKLGLRMKELMQTEFRSSGKICNLIPGSHHINPIVTLMQVCNFTSSICTDEAAMIRLLLLQAITMHPTDQVIVSDSPHLFALNSSIKTESCKAKWTRALDCSDNLQIGTQTAASTLYYRTLDEYTALIAGTANENMLLRDENNRVIDLNSVLFIPVQSNWRGQSWLLPYILAFTTTMWWNHAVVISVEMINHIDDSATGQSMKYELMPRAATVRIHGKYQRICLVVIDSEMSTNEYKVISGISATHEGEFEFAKMVMCYLGRACDPISNIKRIQATDVGEAINHLADVMFTAKEFRKLQLRAAVLSTSRFCGFGIYPSECSPSKAAGEDEVERGHLAGVYKFNCQQKLMIGDYELLDIATLDEHTLQYVLQNRQHWRTDPLGYFAFGGVNISKDSELTPALWQWKDSCIQYQLSECSHIIRVLKACGVFKRERHEHKQAEDLFNTTIAFGSLTLGLTNWAAAELEITLFEHNQMGKRHNSISTNYRKLWPAITQNFVLNSKGQQRVVDSVNHHEILGMSMNLAVWPKNIAISWYDTHYSWNCPWWFAAAIAKKFGWQIDQSHSKQTDLSVLTHSCQYECQLHRNQSAYFEIITPTSSGRGEATNFVSWFPNAYIDFKKQQFGRSSRFSVDSLHGICELNTVVFPSARADSLNLNSRAFVSSSNRIIANRQPSIRGGLKWPNIDANWLLRLNLPCSLAAGLNMKNTNQLAENKSEFFGYYNNEEEPSTSFEQQVETGCQNSNVERQNLLIKEETRFVLKDAVEIYLNYAHQLQQG